MGVSEKDPADTEDYEVIMGIRDFIGIILKSTHRKYIR